FRRLPVHALARRPRYARGMARPLAGVRGTPGGPARPRLPFLRPRAACRLRGHPLSAVRPDAERTQTRLHGAHRGPGDRGLCPVFPRQPVRNERRPAVRRAGAASDRRWHHGALPGTPLAARRAHLLHQHRHSLPAGGRGDNVGLPHVRSAPHVGCAMNADDRPAREPRRTIAIARRSWWPGWIWAVPIAAVAIVLWLLLRSISSRGIDVTVTYNDAAGMQPGDTRVMYHGLEVGRVTSVALASDDWHVIVHLGIDGQLAPKINTGTRFVLEGAHPSFSDAASLRALIAGPTIVMVPGPGKPATSFIGTEGGPRQTLTVSLPYLVSFRGAVGQLKPDAPVMLRGFTVGEVTSVGLAVDPQTGRISTPVLLALDPTRFHLTAPAPADGNWKPLM